MPIIIVMNLKSQLEYYLRKKGWTAAQLARVSKVPQQTLADWMAGDRNPTVTQIKKVSDAIGVSIDVLCFGNGADEESPNGKGKSIDDIGEDWVGGLFEIKVRRVKR